MMKINKFNLFDYLYYRTFLFYKEAESKWGVGDNKNTAALVVWSLLCINLVCFLTIFLTLIMQQGIIKLLSNDYFLYSFGLLLIIFNGVILYYYAKKKHDLVIQFYKNETKEIRRKRGTVLLIYILLSIISIMVLSYLGPLWLNIKR